jgi:hypothetical protein
MADTNTRENMEAAVYAAITAIDFPKETYTHDDAAKLVRELKQVLRKKQNKGNPNGMAGFLDKSDTINDIKLTSYEDADTILDEFRKKAAVDTKEARKADKDAPKVTPAITSRGDANDEAVIRNGLNAAVLGCKEAIIRGIVHLVGTSVTDGTLKEAHTNDAKSTDDVLIYDLIEAVKRNAVRPTPIDVLTKANAVLWHTFDFGQPCINNIEALKKEAGLLDAVGVAIGDSIIGQNIVANVSIAADQPWGRELAEALRTIRRDNPHNKKHDAASIDAMAKALALADQVRTLRDARPITLSPKGIANAVRDEFAHLDALVQMGYEDTDDEGTAAAADSDSEDSGTASRVSRKSAKEKEKEKEKKAKAAKAKKAKERGRAKDRGSKDRNDRSRSKGPEPKWQDNPCPHCRQYKRRNKHPNVATKDCQWNDDFEGWRPRFICDEMELDYVPKYKFDDEE